MTPQPLDPETQAALERLSAVVRRALEAAEAHDRHTTHTRRSDPQEDREHARV
jgi:hypothetical protein